MTTLRTIITFSVNYPKDVINTVLWGCILIKWNSPLYLLLLLGNSKLHLLLRSRYCSDPVRMEDFVIVTDFEGGENIKVDVEDDRMLMMTFIQSQFGRMPLG